jgi:hypothetical protein
MNISNTDTNQVIDWPGGYRIRQTVDGYSNMVRSYLNDGWQAYFMSFMFKHLRGNSAAILAQMKDELDRVYSIFVTHVVRKPTSSASIGRLPILISVPDLPVPKRSKNSKQPLRYVTINDGLHLHAILLVPPHSRLREGVQQHFIDNQRLYVGSHNRLISLDVQPAVTRPGYVTGYALKAVANGRFAYDEVLILPKSRSEILTRRGSLRHE